MMVFVTNPCVFCYFMKNATAYMCRGIYAGTSIFPTCGHPVCHHFPYSTPFNKISQTDPFALADGRYGDHLICHRLLANYQPYLAPMQMAAPWATICISPSYGSFGRPWPYSADVGQPTSIKGQAPPTLCSLFGRTSY